MSAPRFDEPGFDGSGVDGPDFDASGLDGSGLDVPDFDVSVWLIPELRIINPASIAMYYTGQLSRSKPVLK